MNGDEKALLLKESSGHFAKNLTYLTDVKSPLKASVYSKDTNIDDGDGDGDDTGQSEPKIVFQLDRSFMKHTTINMQAPMHILKGSIGTGILALPNAFLSAGLWFGFAGVLIIGAITVHCVHMLVRSSHTLCARTNNIALDYAGAAEMAFKTGPVRLRRAAKAAWLVVNGFLVFIQIGTCCVYIVFVADNVKQVVHHFHISDPDQRIYMVIIVAFLIPYVFVKHLTVLSIFTGFANILTVAGLVIILQYIVRGLPDQSTRPAFNSIGTLPFFLGTTLFAYEGIAVDELDSVAKIWNSHRIRPSRNTNVPNGAPTVMYTLPALYATRDYKQPVTPAQLEASKQECTRRDTRPCDKDMFELCSMIMHDDNLDIPSTPDAAIELYIRIREQIMSIMAQ